MVLSSVDAGKEVTLTDIDGGRGIRSKLTVLNRNSSGPVMVGVKDCRLAIGRSMARKIMVA